ncbi:MAG: hypothetical protein ACOX88_10425 [Christensenellales bacterium]|jgi:hypothetical protein
MGRGIKTLLTLLICLAVTAGCVLLPPVVAGMMDSRLLDHPTVEDAEDALPVAQSGSLNILEKIKLLDEPGADKYKQVTTSLGTGTAGENAIFLETGRVMTQEQAQRRALEEVSELQGLGVFPKIEILLHGNQTSGASFYVDKNDPTKNVIAWVFSFLRNDGGGFGLIYLDDETGKILKYYVQMLHQEISLAADLDQVPAIMGEYLGVGVTPLGRDSLELIEFYKKFPEELYSLIISSEFFTGNMFARYAVYLDKTAIVFGSRGPGPDANVTNVLVK